MKITFFAINWAFYEFQAMRLFSISNSSCCLFFNAISNLYRSLILMQTQVLLFVLNKLLAINFGLAIFQGSFYPIKVDLI